MFECYVPLNVHFTDSLIGHSMLLVMYPVNVPVDVPVNVPSGVPFSVPFNASLNDCNVRFNTPY